MFTHEEEEMKILFDDPFFDGQLLRALGYVYYGGADIGECLTTAQRITQGDADSWYTQWYRLAERVYAGAEGSLAAGHPVSAREAYLRSSNYFRTSYVILFGSPVDPRLVEAFNQQTEAFRKAAQLFSPAVEPIVIPYEETMLPGYFYRVDDSGQPRPTLIVIGGYDGTVEEGYFAGAASALRHGYQCLCFDGPGQGGALLKQHLYFRPDWENVVRPVVDYVLSRPEVDRKRIVLMGGSWGGYLAPRAATGEHRIAACIADAVQYDPAARRKAFVPKELQDQVDDGDPTLFAPIFEQLMHNPMMAFSLKRGMWTHGVSTPLEYVRAMASYTLKGLADRITCPTLVCEAENDVRGGDAKPLYDALTCPKKYILFTNEEGAGEHCEAGARSLFDQRVFDWLDEMLAVPAATAR
jgi:pimeloyl-ACP methyl ester carboxylesterase